MVIELSGVQFWSEIILVISNRTRAARSFDFEITRMISDQIALHLVQLPLLITGINNSLEHRSLIRPETFETAVCDGEYISAEHFTLPSHSKIPIYDTPRLGQSF